MCKRSTKIFKNKTQTYTAHSHPRREGKKKKMLQFYGTYYHRIDDKGRVALPMKFRKTYDRALNNEEISNIDLVITPSPSKDGTEGRECLYVFTTEDFDVYVESIFESAGGYNPRNKKHEQLMRALHAEVEDITIDSAKRINIPAKFRKIAGLGKDVAIVGNAGHFEI